MAKRFKVVWTEEDRSKGTDVFEDIVYAIDKHDAYAIFKHLHPTHAILSCRIDA